MSLRLLAPDLYVKVNRRELSLRDADGKTSAHPLTPNEGFSHSRTFPADPKLASLAVHQFIRSHWKQQGYFAIIKPRLLVHIVEELAGGLSETENRALRYTFESEARELYFVHSQNSATVTDVSEAIDRVRQTGVL